MGRFVPLALAALLALSAAPFASAQSELNLEDLSQHCALPLTVERIQGWIAGIEDGRRLQLAKWALCYALGDDCL